MFISHILYQSEYNIFYRSLRYIKTFPIPDLRPIFSITEKLATRPFQGQLTWKPLWHHKTRDRHYVNWLTVKAREHIRNGMTNHYHEGRLGSAVSGTWPVSLWLLSTPSPYATFLPGIVTPGKFKEKKKKRFTHWETNRLEKKEDKRLILTCKENHGGLLKHSCMRVPKTLSLSTI